MGDSPPRRIPMKCPVCRVPTYVVEFDKIELDLCPDCQGIWFDAGELELLLGTPEARPWSTPKPDEAQPALPAVPTAR